MDLLLHHRDPNLDEPWGEGEEVWLYRAAAGFYLESVFVHIDADGPRRFEGPVSDARALEILALHESPHLRTYFPDTWEAAALARFGTCRQEALAERLAALLEGAERVPHPSRGEPGEAMLRTRVGLFVRTVPGAPAEILEPKGALKRLKRLGTDAETLARLFPASGEVKLLRKADARDWPALEARAPGLLVGATPLHAWHAPDAVGEGHVSAEALYRIDADLHVREIRRGGQAAPSYEVLDRADALLALVFMNGVTEEAKRAAFPDRETWREMQRRAGLSFPEPE